MSWALSDPLVNYNLSLSIREVYACMCELIFPATRLFINQFSLTQGRLFFGDDNDNALVHGFILF